MVLYEASCSVHIFGCSYIIILDMAVACMAMDGYTVYVINASQ